MTNLELLLFAEERGLLHHVVNVRKTKDENFLCAVDANNTIVVYAGKASNKANTGITYTPRKDGGLL